MDGSKSFQNGPRRLRPIKGLQWQTLVRATLGGKGYFGHWQTRARSRPVVGVGSHVVSQRDRQSGAAPARWRRRGSPQLWLLKLSATDRNSAPSGQLVGSCTRIRAICSITRAPILIRRSRTIANSREAVAHLRSAFEVSERRACSVLGTDRTLEVAKRNQASKREPPCQRIHRVR
jgi:hypothetical protein